MPLLPSSPIPALALRLRLGLSRGRSRDRNGNRNRSRNRSRNRISLPLLAFPLSLLLFLQLPLLASAQSTDAPITVAFEVLVSKHIAVEVRINDAGPFRLIFDTGAPITLLSSRAAKAAGLIDREPPSGGGLAALFSTSLAPKRAETFALGDAVQRDMAVMVMDHPAIDQLSAIAGELDGIVGLTFFSRYRTAIDYQAGTLTFTPSDYDRPGLMESGAADALRLMGLGGAGAARNVIGRSIVLGLTLDESAPKDETVVGSIAPQGSAAEAGLLPGDRITRIDGRWIETREDFARALSAIPPNVAVGVVVRREDAEIRLTLVTRSGM